MIKLILDFYEGKLNGDAWEELCQSCYRIRYQSEHYTEIPAIYGGDGGIEGFTQNGIVNQCYYPEKEFSDNELYEHQRDKLSKDIKKLLSPEYKERLQDLGVPIIKEWHFVIPFYKDSRIIKHANTKKLEVLKKKKENPLQYNYISEDFIIIIKQAEDFKFEITKTIRNSLVDTKLDLTIRKIKAPHWEKCDSEKVDNIRRKVIAVMNTINEEDLNEVVDTFVKAYVNGMEIMRVLRISYAEIYEDIYTLEQTYKKQVHIKTRLNTNQSLNINIFNDILDDFETKLKANCQYFSEASIIELKTDIISMWLADCSMQFRG